MNIKTAETNTDSKMKFQKPFSRQSAVMFLSSVKRADKTGKELSQLCKILCVDRVGSVTRVDIGGFQINGNSAETGKILAKNDKIGRFDRSVSFVVAFSFIPKEAYGTLRYYYTERI